MSATNQCLSVLRMGSFSSSVKDGGIYGQYQLKWLTQFCHCSVSYFGSLSHIK